MTHLTIESSLHMLIRVLDTEKGVQTDILTMEGIEGIQGRVLAALEESLDAYFIPHVSPSYVAYARKETEALRDAALTVQERVDAARLLFHEVTYGRYEM